LHSQVENENLVEIIQSQVNVRLLQIFLRLGKLSEKINSNANYLKIVFLNVLQYYYSIKDISIGGMCICYGHARACPINPGTGVSMR